LLASRRGFVVVGTVRALPVAMSEPRNLRCYQYVNRPFPAVRELLRRRPLEVFQHDTTSAAARANAITASLHARVAGLDVGVDVSINVHGTRDDEGVAGLCPVTRIMLAWEATRASSLFPVMTAELSLWPLTSGETQLEIQGAYRPPLGVVGGAVDAAVGHRLAEATVHRFLDDVVEQLRRELPQSK
jgi:hypothetical protein